MVGQRPLKPLIVVRIHVPQQISYTKGMNTNDSAKTIVCYGDSNTWGSVPRSDATEIKTRYPRSVR
jgi:lysophospholipase L1-like esterase